MKDNIGSVSVYDQGVLLQSNAILWFLRCLVWAGSLMAADVLAFVTAGVLFRFGQQIPEVVFYRGMLPVQVSVDLFYFFGFLFLLVRYVAGDYSKRQLFWDGARQTTVGLTVASLPGILVWLFSDVPYSLVPILCSWVFVIFAVPLYRQGARFLLGKLSLWQLPTVLIGGGTSAVDVYSVFRKSLALGFDVRFQVSLTDQGDDKVVDGVTRISLRNPANIVSRLSQAGCLQSVVVADQVPDENVDELINRLMAAGIAVAVIPQLKGLPLLGLTINYFFGRNLILLHVRNNMARLPGRVVKRLIDIVGSVVLLTVLSPLFLAIAAWIKYEGGKVFFVQPRVGRGGGEFPCIKFRTMRPDAEEMLRRWKLQNSPIYQEYVASNFKLHNDPRVTHSGGFLRRYSLDELPQLVNVLLGEMSLVGPRPLLAREICDYGTAFGLYRKLRPGITGLWQISGRSRTTFAQRAAADEWYVKNWSLWYDIVILFKTADVLVRRDGAY